MAKKVVLFGGTGLLGQSLGLALYRLGYSVRVVTRNPATWEHLLSFPGEIFAWDGENADQLSMVLLGSDIVCNLAGEPIGEGRWSDAKKERLRTSRLDTTSRIVAGVQKLEKKPELFLSGSAVGYYGKTLVPVTEDAPQGAGFLADLCGEWEEKATPLTKEGVRVVWLRTGVVLSVFGGALPLLTFLTRTVGPQVIGRATSGCPWIHIDDWVSAVLTAITNKNLDGPMNLVAPTPTTWRDVLLGITEGKGILVSVPPSLVRPMVGEGPVALSESQFISPTRLIDAGFQFKFPDIKAALADLLEQHLFPNASFLAARQYINAPLAKVVDFYADAQNLEKITPPWLNFKVLNLSSEKIEEGTLINYRLKLYGIPFKWQSKIKGWKMPSQFTDVQVKGPYSLWHHTHRFEQIGEGTLVTDIVRYRAPFGRLGRLMANFFIAKEVEKIFQYRKSAGLKYF